MDLYHLGFYKECGMYSLLMAQSKLKLAKFAQTYYHHQNVDDYRRIFLKAVLFYSYAYKLFLLNVHIKYLPFIVA